MAMAAALMVVVAVLGLATGGQAQLQYGFYRGKCGADDVEAVVQGVVRARFAREAPIVAYLLRMQFHECAVNGCDGGLLIDGPGTEKTAAPNLSVKGYDLIADVKAELERRCPGVVSCSDIQILATRDAVALAGGEAYPTSRLYKSGGRAGATDPSLDPYYAFVYKTWVCPDTPASDNNVVFLDDQWSALQVDNNYFKLLQRRRGVLAADQNLYADGSTRWIVDLLANSDLFHSLFPQALIKLGEVNVLTGAQGEIRRVCSKFN
uniref:Plant heme peroxidase family profile domain-containing protein n=1 Tax=Oryza brachyantha TaxID=4533 RepID=J3MWI5_ORYBR